MSEESTETKPVKPTKPQLASSTTVDTIKIEQAKGKRRVRGEVREVDLPHYRVFIGAKLVAVTSTAKNKHVMAVAEILPSEESPVIETVQRLRGDDEAIAVKRPPKVKTE